MTDSDQKMLTEAVTAPVAELTSAEVDEFRDSLASDHLLPLWEIMRRLAAKEPHRGGDPFLWTWRDLRPQVMRAGELVSAEEAERRVIVFDNPAFAGEGRVTNSLYAGVQLILPGEVARSHRHTASALRLILEGEGGYTAVDGERVIMRPGDFIVTPSGVFHDHGNHGDQPMMWLDGLDVFVVNLFNAPFAEEHPAACQPVTRPSGHSLAIHGNGLVPHGFVRNGVQSPMFCWPYERTKEALDALRCGGGEPDAALGWRMNFVDPTTGLSPIRTMTASMSLFPAGYAGEYYRSVSGTVCSVVEGSGLVTIGDREWRVEPKDTFVVPSWHWHRIRAETDMVVFGFSDEVLQRHLGFWRDERRPLQKV